MPQIIHIKGTQPPPKTFMGFQLDKRGLYNGKPVEHWLAMADENVMMTIVRGLNEDKNSLVATVTTERLRALAMALNPSLYYKIVERRNQMRGDIPRLVAHILGHDQMPLCAKHAKVTRKTKKARKRK